MRGGRVRAALAIAVALGLGGVAVAPSVEAAPKPKRYANCAAMNRDYRHGVGKAGATDKVRGKSRPVTNFVRNTALYNANRGRDGDNDGVACEKR